MGKLLRVLDVLAQPSLLTRTEGWLSLMNQHPPASPPKSMPTAKHNPRFHAVAGRLPRLPRELVHEVLNDLWIQKILEILCNYSSPYLDDCVSSHLKIGKILPAADLAEAKETFSLYLRLCALHRGNPHPHIILLEKGVTFFLDRIKSKPIDIKLVIRNAVVRELDRYNEFIPVLNSVVPDQLIPWGNPAFRDTSLKGLKEAFDLIDAAEVKLNTLKANQLRRLADLLERYPNYIKTCCEKNGETSGPQKQKHRVDYLRNQASVLLTRQILDGRFAARAVFAQDQFYLVPYDRVLRLFLKVLQRFPPANIKIETVQQEEQPAEDGDVEMGSDAGLGSESKKKEKIRRAHPPVKPRAPHTYPDVLQPVLEGFAQSHAIGDGVKVPPPRVMHSEYSLPKYRWYGGPSQPHFFIYDHHPMPRELKKWEKIWPMPEKEFEWLEGFLSICDYMAAMKEEWSVGRTVADYWRQHMGQPR